MAGFLYFIPGAKCAPGNQRLQALELGHLADAAFMVTPCSSGPDGRAGLTIALDPACLAEGAAAGRVGYWPEKQTWRRCGGFWLGLEKDSPPRPQDLLKKELFHNGFGYPVKTAKGEFVIPPLRFLPNEYELDDAGCWIRRTEDRFEPLAKLTQRHFDDAVAAAEALAAKRPAPEPDLTETEQLEMAAGYLGLFYYLGRWEISRLGILTDETVRQILDAAIDMPAIRQMAKKKTADSGGAA